MLENLAGVENSCRPTDSLLMGEGLYFIIVVLNTPVHFLNTVNHPPIELSAISKLVVRQTCWRGLFWTPGSFLYSTVGMFWCKPTNNQTNIATLDRKPQTLQICRIHSFGIGTYSNKSGKSGCQVADFCCYFLEDRYRWQRDNVQSSFFSLIKFNSDG